jgi:hypothetical protein
MIRFSAVKETPLTADTHVDIELTDPAREPELVDLITRYRVEWDEHQQHSRVLRAGADEFVRARGVVP